MIVDNEMGLQFEITVSSVWFLSKLTPKDFDRPMVLNDRKTEFPFNRLACGQSFWLDCDELGPKQSKKALLSMKQYNDRYDNIKFAVFKHRWDMRKSGYHYFEFARIK